MLNPSSDNITCLWHLKRCPYQSHEAVDISLAQNACQFGPPGGHCNLLHSPCNPFIVIMKGGFGQALLHSRVVLWHLSSQEFLYFGVQYGQPPRFPSSGCDQSVLSGAPESSISMACDSSMVLEVVSASEFELPSLKVTCLLGCMGLGESAHILAASLVWPSAGVVCVWGLASGGLLWLLEWSQLLECLLLPDQWWLPAHPQLPCHPQETEWLNHSLCPSSMATGASAQQ